MTLPHDRILQSGYRLSIAAAALLSTVIASQPASAVTPELKCEIGTQAVAVILSDRYAAKLQSRHPDQVTRLYAVDAAMQGFASDVTRSDYDTVRAYYLYFLQFEPSMVVGERQVDGGCNYLIDAGTYTWSLKAKGSREPETVATRYRMIYEYIDADWRIVEHVEEIASTHADLADFEVPAPQRPRLAAKVPAVAGFVKRMDTTTSDEPRHDASKEPAKSHSGKPQQLLVKPTSAPVMIWPGDTAAR